MYKSIISIAIGFLIGTSILWGWSEYKKNPYPPVSIHTTAPIKIRVPQSIITTVATTTPRTKSTTTYNKSFEDITVLNQANGKSVFVTRTSISNNGFIAVHSQKNGFIGDALGVVYRKKGVYTNFSIPLLNTTEPNTPYFIVLYRDNGDRRFNIAQDALLHDANNNPIITTFTTF